MTAVRLKSNASAYSLDLSRAKQVAPDASPVVNPEPAPSWPHANVNLRVDDESVAIKMRLEHAVATADAILALPGENLAEVRERIRIGCPLCRQHHGYAKAATINLDDLPVVTYLNNRACKVIPSSTPPADPGEVATLWSVKFRTADGEEHGPYHFTGQRYSAYTDPIVKRLFYAGDMTTLSSYAFGRQFHEWLGRGYLGISDSERYAEIAELTAIEGSQTRNLLHVPVSFLHSDGNQYNGFGDQSLRTMIEQCDYQFRLDHPVPEEPPGPTLREVLADYLHAKGFTGTLDEPWAWHRDDLGVRDFETCVIWQMTREGAYAGDTGTVCGWRPIEVPVPVSERGRYGQSRTIVGTEELAELRARPQAGPTNITVEVHNPAAEDAGQSVREAIARRQEGGGESVGP